MIHQAVSYFMIVPTLKRLLYFRFISYALPSLIQINIFSIAAFFMASFAGPKYLRGSVSSGCSIMWLRKAFENGILSSVDTFTLAHPKEIHYCTSSFAIPEAP